MKQIYLTEEEFELVLKALRKLGATDEKADDLHDAIVYEGRVSAE